MMNYQGTLEPLNFENPQPAQMLNNDLFRSLAKQAMQTDNQPSRIELHKTNH